jgi:hypothetical protein
MGKNIPILKKGRLFLIIEYHPQVDESDNESDPTGQQNPMRFWMTKSLMDPTNLFKSQDLCLIF